MNTLKSQLVFWIFFHAITNVYTQTKALSLANSFYETQEYEKALEIYQQYILTEVYFDKIYEPFVDAQRKLNQSALLIKTLKKLEKKNNDVLIQVDLLLTYDHLNDIKNAERKYKEIFILSQDDNLTLLSTITALKLRESYKYYNALLLDLRKYYKDDQLYAEELIEIYRITGQKRRYIDESLLTLSWLPELRESLQNQFQINFSKEDYLLLEQSLFVYIGNKETTVYQEMLVWMYLQQKDFYEAFVQQRSLDAVLDEGGKILLQIANIAARNKAYEEAEEILNYICKKYPQHSIYVQAKRQLIEIQEHTVCSSYPIDSIKVKAVIDQYNVLKKRTRSVSQKAKIDFSQARLYAFQLKDFDQAMELLRTVINTTPDRNLRAEANLLLGDIYLFDDDSGEASLQYFKVEKKWANSSFSERAKFKNAELYYYTGEIELASSMLDILKRATSREICNDAIELSVFIKSNSGLDTSYQAIQMYAHGKLLSYQQRYTEALKTFDSLVKVFSNHDLADEVLWEKAKIFGLLNQYGSQIDCLKAIELNYPDGILGDDAVFTLAELYERNDQKEQAMAYYKKILINFKGSIYLYQARKAYRRLRGDNI